MLTYLVTFQANVEKGETYGELSTIKQRVKLKL